MANLFTLYDDWLLAGAVVVGETYVGSVGGAAKTNGSLDMTLSAAQVAGQLLQGTFSYSFTVNPNQDVWLSARNRSGGAILWAQQIFESSTLPAVPQSGEVEIDLTLPTLATGVQVGIADGPLAGDYGVLPPGAVIFGQIILDVGLPAATVCNELGRTTRVYASGYQRTRPAQVRLYANESRCLVVDWNGALAAERSIESVTWQTWNGWSMFMSGAAVAVGGRSVSVNIAAQYSGGSILRCTVVLDNGEKYVEQIRMCVLSAPYYGDEGWTTGPLILTAVA